MSLTLEKRRILRLVVLTGLYVGQGIPWGFVSVALVNYFSASGATVADIGNLTALATLPWAFKWAWGPLLDRFDHLEMGRRRPWILAAQTLIAGACGVLVLVPALTTNAEQLGWIILVQNLFVSLQDVSVDALAVDLLPEDERGKANGLMYGGAYLGTIIGGAGLSTVVSHHGLQAGLLIELGLMAAIMCLPLFVRERESDAFLSWKVKRSTGAERRSAADLFRDLRRAFRRRSPFVAALLALSTNVGIGALGVIGTNLIIQDLDWTASEYAQLGGGVGVIFGLGGALLGGFLADLVGHRRLIGIATVLLGASWIGFALAEPLWTSGITVAVFTCVEATVSAALATAMFTLFMDVSWPRVAATQFTAYMAMLNLSSTFGKKLAGPLSETLAVPACFVLFGLVQAALALALLAIDPQQNRRELEA